MRRHPTNQKKIMNSLQICTKLSDTKKWSRGTRSWVSERSHNSGRIVRLSKAKIESLETELEKAISGFNAKEVAVSELKGQNAGAQK